MTARLRLLVLSPLVLIVLIVSAACPLVARAEEATPPPAEGSEVVATEDAPPLDPAEPGPAEAAAPTEAAGVPPAEALPPTDPTEPPPVEAPPDSLAAAVPEGVDVVVLDENGNALPLASNEAAEILVSGDPVWCPAGQLPGDDDCTDAYQTFGGSGGPIGLLDAMAFHAEDICQSSGAPGWCADRNGTIYIAADYSTNNEFNPWAIAIDGEDLASYDSGTGAYTYFYGDLVIQGGWDFVANEHPAGAATTFSHPLTVDWNSDITLNDLIFTGLDTAGPALAVTSEGDISLNHVDLHDNDSAGAVLDNCLYDGGSCAGTGSIAINDSSFTHHYEETPLYYNRTGLEASSGANITLNNVQASNNGLIGANLHKYGEAAGLISVTGSTFSGNFLPGLMAEGNVIELNGVQVAGNGWLYGWEGAVLDNCTSIGSGKTCPATGHIFITDSSFVHNGDTGLSAASVGDISITGTIFEHNGWVDLNLDGIMDVDELPGSYSYGAVLDNCLYDDDPEGCTGSGSILITESLFNGNQAAGLQAYSSGAIAMILSEASGNGLDDDSSFWDRGGAALNNEDAEGSPEILVDGSEFLDNAGVGLFAHSLGDIDVTDSEANRNGDAAIGSWASPSPIGAGALLDNCALVMYSEGEWGCRGSGSITVENSLFGQNAETGLAVETFGAITLDGVHANGNGIYGAELMNDREDTEGTRSTGTISISGPSTFGTQWEPNGGTGLWFDSYGNVTLSDVVASYNGFGRGGEAADGYGITGYTEGEGVSITLTNVTANANRGDGLYLGAYAEYDYSTWEPVGGPALGITLIDVVANANGGSGAALETDGNVWVDPSTFSANDYDGLFVGAAEAVIECSTFTGNGYDGLSASVDGTITVAGCTFGGNGDDDIDVWDGELLMAAGDCEGSGGTGDTGGGGDEETEPPAAGGAPSLNVVSDVGEQQVVELVCTALAGTVLQLSNGDHVEMPCPIEGSATLHHQAEDSLPAGMDEGFTYISGMHLGMAPDPEAVNGLGGSIGLHFVVPSDMQAATLFVMHWDNGQWERLSGSLLADGFFETPHGQTGIYVLAAS